MRVACLLLLALAASAADAVDAGFAVTVTAQDVLVVGERHLVAAVVLDSDRSDLPGTITIVYDHAPPAWTAQALPARQLTLRGLEDDTYRVVADLGPVALGGDEGEPAAPSAPSVEDLAASGAALALGEDPTEATAPASPPASRWEQRRSRVLVLDAGETLLVHCPDGTLTTGGAELRPGDDGSVRLIMVVAAADRFAVLSGCSAAVGEVLELVQAVRVGDGP